MAIVCLPVSNCVENTHDMVQTEYEEGLYRTDTMASMTETVTPNSMIIHANVTIQKSMVARIGSNVVAVQIVRRDQPVVF